MSAHIERWSFVLSVISGIIAAVAGGNGWAVTSVVAGCLAAISPIAGRYAGHKLAIAAEAAADAKIVAAEQRAAEARDELDALHQKLMPRRLTAEQMSEIASGLKAIQPFKVTVSHNRHEAEQKEIHGQLCDALRDGGLDVTWFGGMTNSTSGIEISAPDNADKKLLMAILQKAGLSFLNVNFTDDPEGKRGVEIWVGTHPGLA